MKPTRIRHMAVFTLKHAPQSPETQKFLRDGEEILSKIPAVQKFEVLKQVSGKTDFDYCFSMEFENQEAYDGYNAHPDHQSFVENRWKIEVERFQEIDLQSC